ncbi:MAG: hypothetical protein WAS36_00605 [Candidatus Saccharimonadales bacterium]
MKKLLTIGVTALAVVGLAGVGTISASAMNGPANRTGTPGSSQGQGNGQGNGYQASLESRAKIVGMTTDQLKAALETKTMSQIAKDKGMTEIDFQAKMQAAAKARWETRGLSQAEIAQRVADQAKRHAANSADHEFGSGEGNHQGGYGRNQRN